VEVQDSLNTVTQRKWDRQINRCERPSGSSGSVGSSGSKGAKPLVMDLPVEGTSGPSGSSGSAGSSGLTGANGSSGLQRKCRIKWNTQRDRRSKRKPPHDWRKCRIAREHQEVLDRRSNRYNGSSGLHGSAGSVEHLGSASGSSGLTRC
jgi:hypothetical protein